MRCRTAVVRGEFVRVAAAALALADGRQLPEAAVGVADAVNVACWDALARYAMAPSHELCPY